MHRRLVTSIAFALAFSPSTIAPIFAQSGPPGAPKGPAIAGARPDNITLQAAERAPYGQYLTDQRGHALYIFTRDGDDKERSHCTDACAEAWPPAISADEPKVGNGVDRAKIGSTDPADANGKAGRQVTYNGWPLYHYKVDGETDTPSGQGLFSYDGFWYLLSPAGEPIKSRREGTTPAPR